MIYKRSGSDPSGRVKYWLFEEEKCLSREEANKRKYNALPYSFEVWPILPIHRIKINTFLYYVKWKYGGYCAKDKKTIYALNCVNFTTECGYEIRKQISSHVRSIDQSIWTEKLKG